MIQETFLFVAESQGPFGYPGEYGEKGIPGYPGSRVRLCFLASVKVHLVTLLFEIPSLFPFVRGTPLTISSSSVVGVVCVSAKQGAPGFNGPPGVPGLQVGFVRL